MPIQELDSQLWNGVAPGNAAIVQTLLRHGADPNYRGYAGQTWVHRACLLNCLDQLDLLVDKGGSLTAGDDDRETPLHLAAREGHSVIVERLLALGSDSRQESDYGTPPDRAAYAGHASGMGPLHKCTGVTGTPEERKRIYRQRYADSRDRVRGDIG